MKKRFMFFALLLLWIDVHGKGKCVYTDGYVSVIVKVENQVVTIELKPKVDILIPNNEVCFSIDTIGHVQGKFRNTNCPYYVISDISGQYYSVPTDTTIVYEWEINRRNKAIDNMLVSIDYIPMVTKEYTAKKRNIFLMPNEKHTNVFLINQEDERFLVRHVGLEIAYDLIN